LHKFQFVGGSKLYAGRKIAANNMADVYNSLFVFVFEIFIVMVVNTLISCNFLYKVLIT